MSELQLSLIIVGLIVIAAVYLFNLRQELRYRQKIEETSDQATEEASVAGGPAVADLPEAEAEPRVEPSIGTAESDLPSISLEPRVAKAESAAATHEPSLPAGVKAPNVDYRAELAGGAPLRADLRARLEKELGGVGKPIRIEVREGGEGAWVGVGPDVEPAGSMRIALQLADRRGPVSAAQLARFREIVEGMAAELGASVAFDDEPAALAQAIELDNFCADNDVAIGLNIIPGDVTGLSGTKLRALAESSGFTLTADGAFHLHDEQGVPLIALASMDGVPLEASSIKHLRSQGVTLVIDVARVADGRQTFRRMTELARHFANGLNGAVVDDKRTPLSPAALDKIATQIDAIQGALKAAGIEPGGPLALRLFS
jgi:FtsZ-interacting cell division protein ZipA